jgi:hypothetical protein
MMLTTATTCRNSTPLCNVALEKAMMEKTAATFSTDKIKSLELFEMIPIYDVVKPCLP